MFFLLGVAYAGWVARIPAMRDRLDLGDRDLGLLLLAVAIGAILSFRIAPPLIARYGNRRTTQVGAFLMCVAVTFPGFTPTSLLTAVGLFAIGLSTGLLDVSMNAHGVDVEQRLGKPILGSLHALFSVGGLAGAGIGSVAASQGLTPAVHLSCASILYLVLAFVFGRSLLPRSDAPVPEKKPEGAPRARLNATLVALGAVAFCSSVGEGAMGDWSAVYLRDMLHTSEAVAALGYAAFSLTMVIGRFAGDRLTVRFGAVDIVRYGGLLVAAGLGVGLVFNNVAMMIVGFLSVGLGLSVVMPTAFRASGNVPGVEPAAGLSMMATLGYSGFLVGPPGIGFVAEHLTLRGGLGVVVGLAVVLTVLAPSVDPSRASSRGGQARRMLHT
ncbi:MFS transporter [Pendulispora rubella]|uniref:MFS transporter n=1 Tax=Pendulispora rubella TaxID=2741070 RepID=A0ABZ2KX11_9BACT